MGGKIRGKSKREHTGSGHMGTGLLQVAAAGLLLALCAVLWLPGAARVGVRAAEPDRDRLLAQIDQARGGTFNEFAMVARVHPERPGQDAVAEDAVIEIYVKAQGGPGEENRQLLRFRSPRRLSGQVYLVVGANSWLYQPGLRRPLRISAQQKLFGDAGVAEAAGIVFSSNYQIQDVRQENREGEQLWHLFLTAKNPGVSYSENRTLGGSSDSPPPRGRSCVPEQYAFEAASLHLLRPVLGNQRVP